VQSKAPNFAATLIGRSRRRASGFPFPFQDVEGAPKFSITGRFRIIADM
jgi:hypothetical protein